MVRKVLTNEESYAENLFNAAQKFNWNKEKKAFQKFIDGIENLE